jgi:hypothetical protein
MAAFIWKRVRIAPRWGDKWVAECHDMPDPQPPAPLPPAGPPPGYAYPPPPPPPAWGPPSVWPQPAYGQPGPGWIPPGGRSAQVGSGRFHSMSVGELLDAVFSLYRRNFVLIAAISAIVQVPFSLLQYVIFEVFGYSALQGRLQGAQQALQNPNAPPTTEQVQNTLGLVGDVLAIAGIIGLIGIFVVQPLATAATARAVSDRYLDRVATIGASYRAAFNRLGALVWQSLILTVGFLAVIAVFAVIVALLASAGGTSTIGIDVLLGIALAVVAILIYVRTALAPPAIVLEHLSGWRGLQRSWALVRGLFWRMFGILLLVTIIRVIIGGIVGALIGLTGSTLDANGQLIVSDIAGAFSNVFVSPIAYIAVTLLYYDTRIRKEAFDIEMLAQTL